MEKNLQTVILGNGCFWCTEAIFQQVRGVQTVESGYIGGAVANPTYEQVCTGTTGHAEALKITYDSNILSIEDLLKVFWETHDPTTLNRQGADVGTQYRSAIFYQNQEQRDSAASCKQQLEASKVFKDTIVTTLEPASTWYPAEAYHQNYYNQNKMARYCQFVIRPKLEKLLKQSAK